MSSSSGSTGRSPLRMARHRAQAASLCSPMTTMAPPQPSSGVSADGRALVGDGLPGVAAQVEQAGQLGRRRVGVDEQRFHGQLTRWGGSGRARTG